MITTKTKPIKPVLIKRATLDTLPDWYRDAVQEALKSTGLSLDDFSPKVRVETFKMSDIVRIFSGIFHWPMTIKEIKERSRTTSEAGVASNKKHIAQVDKIIKTIQQPQPPWPYISFRAEDIKELQEVDDYGNYISVPNHGDGWHRLVALNTMKFARADILFMKRV